MEKKVFLTISALLLLCISCKKFVAVETPSNQIGSGVVFQNNETANAALLNIYAQMVEQNANPYNLAVYCGLYTDELKNYASVAGYVQLYGNALNPLNSPPTNNIWSIGYNYIYQANAIIEGCQNSPSLNAEMKKQITAEALFIRSFWYFYIINLYGSIPLNLTSDYRLNMASTQANGAAVYPQIVNDLKKSIEDLNTNYVDGTGYTTSTQRLRANKAVAKFLLSRVYLYTGNYAEAEANATEIIANDTKYKLEDISKVFLANNSEAVWQIAKPLPNGSNFNTQEGRGFILTARPALNISNSTTISASLLSAFDLNDLRLKNWIGKYTDVTVTPNTDYYYPAKYKVRTGTPVTEYSTVMRMGELFLIRAEARSQLNNLSGAIADIDKVRDRAKIPLVNNTDPGISKENLLALIAAERRRELFTEWGHRFLDLKRTNKIDLVMPGIATSKGGSWSSYKQYWPIPQNDLLNNPKFNQNDGYQR